MLVALTPRHFRELAELTGTAKAIDALADALGVDFTDEGSRFRHREALDGLFSVWFSDRGADEIAAALGSTSVLWERYRTFAETAADQRVTANPLFRALRQPRIGEYLAPGLPLSVNGTRSAPVPAPALGDDTAEVLAELGVPAADVQRLTHAGIVR
jgi:2-methylfumaryl-CoA isomerase